MDKPNKQDVFRFRCLNCDTTESARAKMPDLLEAVGRGQTVTLGQVVEMTCWECGVTQRHVTEAR